MEITEQDDADQYKQAYIKYTEQFLVNGKSESGLTALEIVNINLGYYAGYYSSETQHRVERLFNTSHPIFGSIKTNAAPTTKEAYDAGLKAGSRHKSKTN